MRKRILRIAFLVVLSSPPALAGRFVPALDAGDGGSSPSIATFQLTQQLTAVAFSKRLLLGRLVLFKKIRQFVATTKNTNEDQVWALHPSWMTSSF